MGKKYLDEDGLRTLWLLIKGLFHRFEGADISKDGIQGEVPAPQKATQDYNKFLKGDGTWATPTNTTYDIPTSTNPNGLFTYTEKQKLAGIESGAEVNQNAFGKIIVDGNSTTVDADAKVDTLTFKSGSNITLTPNATDDSITISATDTTYTPASTNPLMDGTAAVGTSVKYAREDHVHPTDTSRAPTSHASTATTYGKGTDKNYGHVKLSDSTTATTAAASGGTAATPKAVSDALAAAKSYADSLDTGVSDVTVDGTSVVTNGVASVVLSGKVDKVSGKGLSTNDFTNTYKTALDNLDTTYAKKSDIAGVYKYKGTKATQGELPSNPSEGDVWNIEAASDYGAAGMNVAWNGSAWDALGGLFTIDSLTTSDIQTICSTT